MDAQNVLKLTRTFDAPRQLVWASFSQAEHLAHWWGPKGCHLQIVDFEFREGGAFHYFMDMPNNPMWGKITYESLIEPEKIVYLSGFANADGEVIRAPFSELFPLLIRSELTLTEVDGQTIVQMQGYPLNATQAEIDFFNGMKSNMEQGFGSTFDQLAEYLPKVA